MPDRDSREKLRALIADATPLPWHERDGHYRSIQGSPSEGERFGDLVTTLTGTIAQQQGQGKANTALIVAAVNALPDLLALAERAQPDAGEGWQPIETAPKDGEYLGGRWDDGMWMSSVLRGYGSKPFTHWRALPASPACPAEEE